MGWLPGLREQEATGLAAGLVVHAGLRGGAIFTGFATGTWERRPPTLTRPHICTRLWMTPMLWQWATTLTMSRISAAASFSL